MAEEIVSYYPVFDDDLLEETIGGLHKIYCKLAQQGYPRIKIERPSCDESGLKLLRLEFVASASDVHFGGGKIFISPESFVGYKAVYESESLLVFITSLQKILDKAKKGKLALTKVNLKGTRVIIFKIIASRYDAEERILVKFPKGYQCEMTLSEIEEWNNQTKQDKWCVTVSRH